MIRTKTPFKTEASNNLEITLEGKSIRSPVSRICYPHAKPALNRETSFHAFPTECSESNFTGISIFQVDLDSVDKEPHCERATANFLILLLLLRENDKITK